MAGIGEVSAVIGVVQVGFSLARTLNTYIGDYKDSRDSIISLASELDATIIQVKELNSLVASKNTDQTLGEGSLKLAEKCIKDSDRLIKKIVDLLTKARLPKDATAIVSIKPEDIDVSRLTRLSWPWVKPQVNVVRSELHVMKTDILLARSCIQSQTGSTAADRAAGDESIVAHAKSLKLARQLLRKARDEEQRLAMSPQIKNPVSDTPTRHVRITDGPPRVSGGTQGDSSSRPPIRRSTGLSADGEPGGILADRLAREIREDIVKDLERKERERKETEAAEEERRKLAVEVYQNSVKERLASLQERSEALQRQLTDIFGNTLDEKQLQRFLEKQLSQQMQDEFGEMLLKLGMGPSAPPNGLQSDGLTNAAAQSPKRRWFSRRRSPRSPPSSKSRQSSMLSSISGSSTDTQDTRYEYIEGIVSFDPTDHVVWDWTSVLSGTLRHQPCGRSCNLQDTMTSYHAIPQSVRKEIAKLIEPDHIPGIGARREWHLHAAMRVDKDIRKAQKLLQRAIMGKLLSRGAIDTLLVYCRLQREDGTDDTNSDLSSIATSVGLAPTPRVELSQTDLDQMRTWLHGKGLSVAKVKELETRLVRLKDPPSQPALPTATNDNFALENDRRENGEPLVVDFEERRRTDRGSRNQRPVLKKGKTRMPKRIIHRNALYDLAYPYDEEEDFFILRNALSKDQIDEVVAVSHMYKESDRKVGEYFSGAPTVHKMSHPAIDGVAVFDEEELPERPPPGPNDQLLPDDLQPVARRMELPPPNLPPYPSYPESRGRGLGDELAEELAEIRAERRRGYFARSRSSSPGDSYHAELDRLEREKRAIGIRKPLKEEEERIRKESEIRRLKEEAKKAIDDEARETERKGRFDRYGWGQRMAKEKAKADETRIEAQNLERTERKGDRIKQRGYFADDGWAVGEPREYRIHRDRSSGYDHNSGADKAIGEDRRGARGPLFQAPSYLNPFSPFSPMAQTSSPGTGYPVRNKYGPHRRHERVSGSRLSPVYERPFPTYEGQELIRGPVKIRDGGWEYPMHQRELEDYNYPVEVVPRGVPRTPSPGSAQEETSDAEDADLDDEQLKNKMLVKYTGGVPSQTAPDIPDNKQSPMPNSFDNAQWMGDGNRPEAIPIPGVQRKYTATVEELDEAEGDPEAHAGDEWQPGLSSRLQSISPSTPSSRSSPSRGRTAKSGKQGTDEGRPENDEIERNYFENLLLDAKRISISSAKRWW